MAPHRITELGLLAHYAREVMAVPVFFVSSCVVPSSAPNTARAHNLPYLLCLFVCQEHIEPIRTTINASFAKHRHSP